jgi:integrase
MPRASLKQRKDGRYCAVYKGIHFMGDSQTEAYAKRDAYRKQVEAGIRAEASGITVAQYAAQWLKIYKSDIGLRTYNEHVREVNAITSVVGDKTMKDVTPSDIQRIYNTRAGKSASYIKHLVQTVAAIFSAAAADRIITNSPCYTPKPPKGTAGTHRALEQWERDLIRRSTHRFQPAVMCMLYAGLRRGEVLALNVDRDVDFAARTITVREAIRFDSNQPILSDPKTEAGKRTIPMLPLLADTLRGIHGLVAPAASGKHMSETAFRRAWNGFLHSLAQILTQDAKNASGPVSVQRIAIRTHDLRHTYCTMLYDAGVDLKTAMLWMGHADQTMTLRIYTHLTAQKQAESTEKFLSAFGDDVLTDVQTDKVG